MTMEINALVHDLIIQIVQLNPKVWRTVASTFRNAVDGLYKSVELKGPRAGTVDARALASLARMSGVHTVCLTGMVVRTLDGFPQHATSVTVNRCLFARDVDVSQLAHVRELKISSAEDSCMEEDGGLMNMTWFVKELHTHRGAFQKLSVLHVQTGMSTICFHKNGHDDGGILMDAVDIPRGLTVGAKLPAWLLDKRVAVDKVSLAWDAVRQLPVLAAHKHGDIEDVCIQFSNTLYIQSSMAAAARLTRLESLDISTLNSSVARVDISPLKSLGNTLKRLTLTCAVVKASFCETLDRLTGLEDLALAVADVDDATVACIANKSALRRLQLQFGFTQRGQSLHGLQGLVNLRRLFIDGGSYMCGLQTPHGLIESMSELEELFISRRMLLCPTVVQCGPLPASLRMLCVLDDDGDDSGSDDESDYSIIVSDTEDTDVMDSEVYNPTQVENLSDATHVENLSDATQVENLSDPTQVENLSDANQVGTQAQTTLKTTNAKVLLERTACLTTLVGSVRSIMIMAQTQGIKDKLECITDLGVKSSHHHVLDGRSTRLITGCMPRVQRLKTSCLLNTAALTSLLGTATELVDLRAFICKHADLNFLANMRGLQTLVVVLHKGMTDLDPLARMMWLRKLHVIFCLKEADYGECPTLRARFARCARSMPFTQCQLDWYTHGWQAFNFF